LDDNYFLEIKNDLTSTPNKNKYKIETINFIKMILNNHTSFEKKRNMLKKIFRVPSSTTIKKYEANNEVFGLKFLPKNLKLLEEEIFINFDCLSCLRKILFYFIFFKYLF
jgi:hypothetical protein